MTFPQVREHREPVPIRQIQLEEDEVDILMLSDELHGLGRILCLQDRRLVLQVLKYAAKCFSDQEMMIHEQDLCRTECFGLIAARQPYAIQTADIGFCDCEHDFI